MPKEIKKHETHATCNKRLQQKGGKAECCWCVPHSHCEFMKPKSLKEKIWDITMLYSTAREEGDDEKHEGVVNEILVLFEGEKQKWVEENKPIIKIKQKETIALMTQIMNANVLYGAEFLKWVMENIKWLTKEYESKIQILKRE